MARLMTSYKKPLDNGLTEIHYFISGNSVEEIKLFSSDIVDIFGVSGVKFTSISQKHQDKIPQPPLIGLKVIFTVDQPTKLKMTECGI
jgi:hypothetical protein